MDGVLCDELLEEVLHRLPRGRGPSFAASTAADVSLVSKRWLRLYRSTTSALSLRLPQGNSTPHALSSFLSHFPNISSLSLTVDFLSFCPYDQTLLSVASSCTKLTHLSLQTLPPNPVSRSSLLSLSTSCPHLTSLHITLSTPCYSHWLQFFHSLKHLSISFTFALKRSEPVDAALEGKFDGQLELETLCVSWAPRLDDYDLEWLWKSCKKLKKLQVINCCQVFDVYTLTSSFVNCLKGLKEVELIHCGCVLDKILSKLVDNCASLSYLLVHNGDEPYDGRGLLQFITHSVCNLRKLDLHLPRGGLKDDLLLAVADKCTGLSSLRLRGNWNWSAAGEGIKTMMLAMSNELEELALVECFLRPGLLTILRQKFRNLRFLDLSWSTSNVAAEVSKFEVLV